MDDMVKASKFSLGPVVVFGLLAAMMGFGVWAWMPLAIILGMMAALAASRSKDGGSDKPSRTRE